MDGPVFFFNRIPTREKNGVADLWWTVSGAGAEGGEEDQGQLHERGRFKYAFDEGRFCAGRWLAGRAAV